MYGIYKGNGSSPAAGHDIDLDCSVRDRCEDSGKTLSVCTTAHSELNIVKATVAAIVLL